MVRYRIYGDPALAIVIPVCDQAGNVAPSIAEIEAALVRQAGFELIVVVDDPAPLSVMLDGGAAA